MLRTGNMRSGSKGSRALVRVHATRSSGLSGAELSRNRIAYVRTAAGRYGFGQQDVHVRTLRSGHDRRVYRALSGGANGANVTRPSLTEDLKAFVWARTNNGSGSGNRLVRYDTHTARLRYARGSSLSFSSGWASRALGIAVLEDRSGTGSCVANVNDTPDKSQCSVKLTGPVSWKAKP